ncbi:MAG: ABC-F family ATP-binding cassette domain-containing protein [bacterium]
MLYLKNISKQFSENILFKDVSFQINLNDRMGLIGRNGSGKSTLFSMIMGEFSPDSGQIEKNKNTLIGCLKQETIENASLSLIEEVVNICPHLTRIKERINFLHEEIAAEKDQDKIENYVQRLGNYQAEFESRGGYNLEYQAKRILFGLGFKDEDMTRSLHEFSGGWRMRLSLAKLLLQEPDLLLLDEPTNHLDLESVIWLEDFLKGYQGAIVIISHDRRFLNNIVTSIIEIDQKKIFRYSGNYDNFLNQKQARQELLEASYKNQQKKIGATEQFIERFRYKATKAKQVQSRVKSLEKIDKIKLEEKGRSFSVTIPPAPRSGKEVLQLKNVSKRYGEKVIYKGLNLSVNRGDRIAFVGPNGTGKSTLLKIMAGVLEVEDGEMLLGYNVFRAYFAQHQMELLNPKNTILEEIESCLDPSIGISSRSYLGAFLFRGEDVFKKVIVLSGGEKSRLVLAKMLLGRPNLLFLDEPTNHLDISSRDCLQEALSQYSGTICMISHDRIFINQLVNKIFYVHSGQIEVFLGNYDDYLYQIQQNKDIAGIDSFQKEPIKKEKKNKDRQEQKRLEAEKRNQRFKRLAPLQKESLKVQEELKQLDERLNYLTKLFTDPAHYQHPDFPEKLKEYKLLKAKNEELTNCWAELEEKIEML